MSEGVEQAQKNEEKVIPLTEIAKLYNLQIKGEELLFPKGGLGDEYRQCLELVRKHGYKYGGKGSYKFVREQKLNLYTDTYFLTKSFFALFFMRASKLGFFQTVSHVQILSFTIKLNYNIGLRVIYID